MAAVGSEHFFDEVHGSDDEAFTEGANAIFQRISRTVGTGFWRRLGLAFAGLNSSPGACLPVHTAEQACVSGLRLQCVPAFHWAAHDSAQALPRAPLSGTGLAIAAPGVMPRVCDQASAHGIQIDVGGDGFEDVYPGGFTLAAATEVAFDEDAFEAVHPERAFSIMTPVVPAAEAFFEFFDETREVCHAQFEAFELGLGTGFHAETPPFLELGLQLADVVFAVEDAQVG